MSSSETQEPDLDNASVGRVHFEKDFKFECLVSKDIGRFFRFQARRKWKKMHSKTSQVHN
jgi:hypothetical protein